MTPREYCLARVLTDARTMYKGPVIVLRSWDVAENWGRRVFADVLARGGERTLVEPQGGNTHQEAADAHARVHNSDITIVTSAYHQLRAFLTYLAVFSRTTRIWNAPVPSGFDLLAGEFEKIEQYQAKGDCASYDRAVEYLKWRDAQ